MRPKHAALWVVRVLFSDELASEHWNSQGPNKWALQTFNQLPTPRPRTTHQYQTTTNDLAFVPLSTNMHSNIQKHAFMLVLVHASITLQYITCCFCKFAQAHASKKWCLRHLRCLTIAVIPRKPNRSLLRRIGIRSRPVAETVSSQEALNSGVEI